MSHKSTLKFEVAIGSYNLKVPAYEAMIDAYMPFAVDVPADKQPHPLELDAGSRRRVHMFVISSDAYEEAQCPKNGPALQFRYLKWKDPAARTGLQPVADTWLDLAGPSFYSGLTLGMLPETIDGLEFRNSMSKPVKIEVLVAKKGCNGDGQAPGATGQQQSAALPQPQ